MNAVHEINGNDRLGPSDRLTYLWRNLRRNLVYLWHGYRQYGARAIAERFGAQGTEVYRLGGLASFLLHLIVITGPEIFLSLSPRKRWPRWYMFKLALCLRLDSWMPLLPTTYVVYRRNTKD